MINQKLMWACAISAMMISACDGISENGNSLIGAGSGTGSLAVNSSVSNNGTVTGTAPGAPLPPANPVNGAPSATPYPTATPYPSPAPVQPLPPATQTIYTHSGTYLYAYDPRNNSETLVGRFGPPGGGMFGTISDIAVSASGVLIGISCLGLIYQINPTNAELTQLMNYPGGGNAITFLSNGTLIAAGGSRITTINLANRTITPFVQDQYFSSSGDIAALPDGFLYESVVAGASDNLVKIDPNTGHTVVVGSVGFKDVAGLAYAYGKLYGFNLSGTLLEINPATGRGTAIGVTTLDHYGAAASPVAW